MFDLDGYSIVPDVASEAEIGTLLKALEAASDREAVRTRGEVYAIRNLLTLVPEVMAWAESKRCRELVEPVLGSGARPVRGILFDKNADANWKVPWHQDLSIAVQERRELEGFGPWSVKAGVLHVQPPVGILEQMVAVRLHLDECGWDNGPVRVMPGSHRHGRGSALPGDPDASVLCTVPRGGVLMMRPLLWHASSPAESPAHRRVIHIEFCGGELPGGLRWVS